MSPICSGHAVVTGVAPSPPRYMPLCVSRIRFSVATARRFFKTFARAQVLVRIQSVYNIVVFGRILSQEVRGKGG